MAMTPNAPLRLLIVDDEPLARLRLRHLVEQCAEPAAEVIGEAGHALQALEALRQRPCDALLLDIQLPGSDGLQLAQALRAMPDAPAVIFVTAHASHALKAFELEAVDYLTKPVPRERLQQALRRVAARAARPAAAEALPVPAAEAAGWLHVVERQRTLRIPIAEVTMARAGDKQVTLSTAARDYTLDLSLAELQTRLGAGFLRVHRSALVARRAVRELGRPSLRGDEAADDGWAVRVAPVDVWVPVSRRLLPAVRAALGAN